MIKTANSSPVTVEQLSIGLTSAQVWTQINESKTSNNLYATCERDSGSEDISDYLYVRNFNFNLPEHSHIQGIIANIEKKGSGTISDNLISLTYLDGEDLVLTSPGKKNTENWSITDVLSVYGDDEDIWNRVWSLEEINSEQFGLVISVKIETPNESALIDYINLEIHYITKYVEVPIGGANLGSTADINLVYQNNPLHRVMMTGNHVIFPNTPNPIEIGIVNVSYNSLNRKFSWYINHNVLQPTELRLSGPAIYGKAANVFGIIFDNLSSPISGSAIFTEQQEEWLLSGQLYASLVNSSQEHIRAQIHNPGIFGGGHAGLIFNETSSGGIDVGGGAKTIHTFDLSGGSNIGGSGECLLIRQINPNDWNLILTGDEAVPSNVASNTATAQISLEINGSNYKVHWKIIHDYLDVDIKYIRINGPADYGEIGPEKISISNISGKVSPIIGSATIDETTKNQISNGLCYVYIQNKTDVKIRSQIYKSTGLNVNGSSYNYIISKSDLTGGLTTNGESNSSLSIGIYGGIEVSGLSDFKYTSFTSSTGGVNVSGISFVDPYIGDGGAISSPISENAFIYKIETSGGIVCSGKTNLSNTIEVSGGIYIAGTPKFYEYHYPTGGSEVSGHADIRPAHEVGTGGIVCGGKSKNNNPIFGSGGATLSGNVKDNIIIKSNKIYSIFLQASHVVSPDIPNTGKSGIIDVSYNAITNKLSWHIVHNIPDISQLRLNGPANHKEIANIFGIIFDNLSSPIDGFATITSEQERWLLDGEIYVSLVDSSNKHIRGHSHNAGIFINSNTEAIVFYYTNTSGGSIASGSADVSISYNTKIENGVEVSGSYTDSVSFVPTGGMIASPAFEISTILNIETFNGVLFSSSTEIDLHYNIEPEDGISIGGKSIIAINISAQGGATISGFVEFKNSINPPILGGALVNGSNKQTFTDYYIAIGGCIVRPKAKKARIKFFTKNKKNYGYALKGENIFDVVDNKKTKITSYVEEYPELDEKRFRIQHNPKWCNVDEKCVDGAILPESIKKRQKEYIPAKKRERTNRDRRIAETS